MQRYLLRFILGLIASFGPWVLGPIYPTAAQIDPAARDQIVPAAVQIAVIIESSEDGVVEVVYVPVGSGTVISPDGFVLTNWHVVDVDENRAQLERWENQARTGGQNLTLTLDEDRFLILGANGKAPPQPLYAARIAGDDPELDLAVLQITEDASGTALSSQTLELPFIPMTDSDAVELGEPIDIFSYPGAGGDSLTYTTGVVSGFLFDDDTDRPIWITTDATLSGGSSGGTAVNRQGQLIGVPTQGSQLDCRPGDTDHNGEIDPQDVGCVPVGGSIGEIRPINLARPLLAQVGVNLDPAAQPESGMRAATAPIVAPTMPQTPQGGERPTQEEMASYCSTSPVYQIGTRLVLEKKAAVYTDATSASGRSWPALSSVWLVVAVLNPGVEVEISGPFVEEGVCDVWPVRLLSDEDGKPSVVGDVEAPGDSQNGFMHEWDLRSACQVPSGRDLTVPMGLEGPLTEMCG